MGADGIFDDSRQLLQKGLFAGSKVKKIEGQTVVHRREKMSLPKFDLALPQRAADRRGQTAIIPCGDREHGRGAVANDCPFRPNRITASPEAHQMCAETDGVQTIKTPEEILAEFTQADQFVLPVS